jgi:hypothetical protein
MLRLLGRRPEGAVTNQPRATPWDHVQQPGPSTESAIQNSVLGGLRAHKSRDLWRPYRAFPFLESRFPGALPWAGMLFPLRGGIPEWRNIKTRASGWSGLLGTLGGQADSAEMAYRPVRTPSTQRHGRSALMLGRRFPSPAAGSLGPAHCQLTVQSQRVFFSSLRRTMSAESVSPDDILEAVDLIESRLRTHRWSAPTRSGLGSSSRTRSDARSRAPITDRAHPLFRSLNHRRPCRSRGSSIRSDGR